MEFWGRKRNVLAPLTTWTEKEKKERNEDCLVLGVSDWQLIEIGKPNCHQQNVSVMVA
jgi:hypothetical protein